MVRANGFWLKFSVGKLSQEGLLCFSGDSGCHSVHWGFLIHSQLLCWPYGQCLGLRLECSLHLRSFELFMGLPSVKASHVTLSWSIVKQMPVSWGTVVPHVKCSPENAENRKILAQSMSEAANLRGSMSSATQGKVLCWVAAGYFGYIACKAGDPVEGAWGSVLEARVCSPVWWLNLCPYFMLASMLSHLCDCQFALFLSEKAPAQSHCKGGLCGTTMKSSECGEKTQDPY